MCEYVNFMHGFSHSYQCTEKLLKTNINQRNEDSVETTSYMHKQDLVRVLLTQVSTSRGLRELGK